MSWEYWIIAISIGIVAIAIVALVVFLIMTLVSLRNTVKKINHDLDALDPFARVVTGVGKAIEKRTKNVHQLSDEVEEEECFRGRHQRSDSLVNTALEVGEWVLIGLALSKKIIGRR